MSSSSVNGRGITPNVLAKPQSSVAKRVTPEDLYD